MSDVDIFAGLTDETPVDSAPAETADTSSEAETTETVDETSSETVEETTDAPVETVATVPDGALSVTDFAAYVTQQLMKSKIMAGEDLDGTEYTVPQAVYQTVKAAKDRIPHILVKAEGDTEPRVYILRDEALVWWNARRDRIATRGATATRASNRTPEENLVMLAGAVEKNLYALDRQAMWNEKVTQSEKLVAKYKGFLSAQSVDENTVTLAVQEATDTYNTEKANKAAEKAAAKKSDKSEATDEATPETVDA